MRLISVLLCVVSVAGCHVTLPNVHRIHHAPCGNSRAVCPPVLLVPQQPKEQDMTLTVSPTEVLPKALQGIAELCCATSQFKTETSDTEANSLELYTHWPEISEEELSNGALTAPLCFVGYDSNLDLTLLNKQRSRLATGEFFLQIALVEDTTIVDRRSRFNDVANRHGAIMRQMLELSRTSDRWWMTEYTVPRETALNDVNKFPFVDSDSNRVRVRVFPNIVTWKG